MRIHRAFAKCPDHATARTRDYPTEPAYHQYFSPPAQTANPRRHEIKISVVLTRIEIFARTTKGNRLFPSEQRG